MGKYWRVIGHYNGEAQTFEALAGTFQTSPYSHDEDARLVGIRLITAPEAATSLVEGFQVRLSCAAWKPNVMHVAGCGNGLATVPAIPAPIVDYDVDQPVKAGVPITIEARHAVATAVTANVLVLGCFVS
jgi:hypothetical protein